MGPRRGVLMGWGLLRVRELGLWNAWILTVPPLIPTPIFLRLHNEKGAPDPRKMRLPKTKTAFIYVTKLIHIPAVIYSVFLPLRLGTVWFYVGLPIALAGIAGSMLTLVNWADTQPGKPVTGGLHRYSRHPGYLTGFLVDAGVTIASASWLYMLFAIITGVGMVASIDIEEAQCLGHYGRAYREYMDRTPRWIGIPEKRKK